jgi:hypothetical protein
LILYLHMHHAKNYTNNIFPLRKMPPRTRLTARKSTGPIGVPRHQLAPRHESSSSGPGEEATVCDPTFKPKSHFFSSTLIPFQTAYHYSP